MSSFAKRTTVTVDKSHGELRRILTNYKATGFMFAEIQGKATVVFEMHDRRLKFSFDLPSTGISRGKVYTFSPHQKDQEIRRLWRCLVLHIKANLEAVESGISKFEEVFLANILLPNGQTMGDTAIPQIAQSYKSGKMPPLLGYHTT